MTSRTTESRRGFSKNLRYEKHKLLFTYSELLQVRWSLYVFRHSCQETEKKVTSFTEAATTDVPQNNCS